MKKNSDPDDVSLFKGNSYFPPDDVYRAYLKTVPNSEEVNLLHYNGAQLLTKWVIGQKSTCTYLKAVNKQDKKKFKNMDITGTVNIQCSHVFIQSSVDMQFGER
jgi:hypothetical protein